MLLFALIELDAVRAGRGVLLEVKVVKRKAKFAKQGVAEAFELVEHLLLLALLALSDNGLKTGNMGGGLGGAIVGQGQVEVIEGLVGLSSSEETFDIGRVDEEGSIAVSDSLWKAFEAQMTGGSVGKENGPFALSLTALGGHQTLRVSLESLLSVAGSKESIGLLLESPARGQG